VELCPVNIWQATVAIVQSFNQAGKPHHALTCVVLAVLLMITLAWLASAAGENIASVLKALF
jgi:hypothetical protein